MYEPFVASNQGFCLSVSWSHIWLVSQPIFTHVSAKPFGIERGFLGANSAWRGNTSVGVLDALLGQTDRRGPFFERNVSKAEVPKKVQSLVVQSALNQRCLHRTVARTFTLRDPAPATRTEDMFAMPSAALARAAAVRSRTVSRRSGVLLQCMHSLLCSTFDRGTLERHANTQPKKGL